MNAEMAVRVVLTALTLAFDVTAVLLVAWIVILANQRRSSLRHAVWVAAFVALLLLPVFTVAHRATTTIPIKISTITAVSAEVRGPAGKPTPGLALRTTGVAGGDAPRPDWPTSARLLLGVWLAGSIVLFAWTGAAVLGLRSLFRSSVPIEWCEGEYERLSTHFDLRRGVALRMCRPGVHISAMTWGVRRPVILLPGDAATWSDDERASILMHELAHVHRCDSLYQLLAAIVTSMFWFHPAVWLASWSMRTEAETAADDAVVRSGVRASDYAAQLIGLVAKYESSRRIRLSLGVFMMKRSGIEKRVRSIVDPDRRRRGATLTQVALIGVIAVLAVFFLTNIRPILKTGPDQREKLFDAALFTATRHQRDPVLHRRAMNQKWGSRWLAKPESALSRMVANPRKKAILPSRKHSFVVAMRSKRGSSSIKHAAKKEAVSTPDDNSSLTQVAAVSQAAEVDTVSGPRPVAITAPAPVVQALQLVSPVVVHRQSWTAPISETVASRAMPVPRRTPLAVVETVKQPSVTQAFPPFHAVVAGPQVQLTLNVGTAQSYAVDCSGNGQHDVAVRETGDTIQYTVDCGTSGQKELTAQVVNGVLYLRGSGQIGVITTTPKLDRLEVTGNSTVRCTGFSDKEFELLASGHSTVEVDGLAARFQMDLTGNSVLRGCNLTADRLQAGISGNSSMELGGEFGQLVLNAEKHSSIRASGDASRLDLTGSSSSSVDCSGLNAKHVHAVAMMSVAMSICATQSLNASASMSSKIQCSGQPKRVKATPDGSSQILF